MSSMKGGFTTLNRWFGRKKDKSGVASANGKLSKSTTQLHHLSTDQGMHINEASQLDYNRITPLPAATSNAPFEQTFRITVLLPKDQLYVTRLGARVPLSKLLSLVCDNKQLDADKYEFRNPVDASQVYSCESTIGAVGLSEIRLCHKSESYDSFNADSMLKFQRTAAARDSLSSSSEFSSSRHSHTHSTHSKLPAKTPSPYSSSNSLNSMDSTGMNYTRTPVVVPPKALAPPPRKKRVAPRPPSQLVIPEQSVAQFSATPTEPAYAVIVKRPQLCMSTPNLASTPELDAETEREPSLELDCNGNSAKTPDAADSGHYATVELKPNPMPTLPEPTPRKRLLQLKKKAAPAPPPDLAAAGAAAAAADSISLASTTASMTEVLTPPPVQPQPAPRITTPIPMAMNSPSTPPSPQLPEEAPALPTSAAPQLPGNGNQNVSKVLLNRTPTPTPEPRSLGSATEEEEEEDNNDAASKQADSGIGEPLPSSTPSPEPEPEQEPEPESQQLATRKCQIESSSEDEEAIKVYNFKTSCESSLKIKQQPAAPTTLAELSVLTSQQPETEDELTAEEQHSPRANGASATPSSASELTSLSSWNYAVPISPPPDFSDGTQALTRPRSTASTPLDEIVDELSTIIQQQRLDTLIRQPPDQPQIEAAKPNRLANFSIAAIGNATGKGNVIENGMSTARSSSSNSSNSSPTITRADSFQASSASPRHSGLGLGLRLRSSSQLSLNRIELNGSLQQQRRSSSELSIAESPSLQSLELIKNILSNSRKNSLADTQPESQLEPQPEPVPVPEPVPEQKPQQQQQLEQSEKPKSSPQANTVVSTVVPTVVPTVVSTVVSTVASTTVSTVVSTAVPAAKPLVTAVSTPASATDSTDASARSSPVREAARTVISPEPKPLPPTYRYSGPPSINFATWSERPKSQVAIKNEGDYIYGGARASAAPAKLTIEVASPILRMGIPRKEYHVPITVKPLRDASQEREQKMETQLERQEQKQEEKQEQKQEEKQGEKLVEKQEEKHVEKQEPRQELFREFVKPSTLPRPARSNRYTLPAGVPVAGGVSTNSLPRPNATLEMEREREREKEKERASLQTEPAAAPFGQNTLRRTGFKERMLAKEQQEKEQALRVRVSVNGMATPTTAAAAATSPPATAAKPTTTPTPTILRSSKLELKLETGATPTPTTALLQVKLRPTSQMATTRSSATPTPTPPAPPAPPMLAKARPVRSGNALTPTTPDPRDQLLEAIRNFKRGELNRA
ncbi:flocculation protein FLO11 [Drosophila novamexicana]|uniref:flocculation protein FLO11 n=1 Tax=Drosophila novamexicana TaxID=47314 RepID=UPI0011E5969F|nr:flocculation protein FLO11 [Drosophila novamexicana]